MAGYAMRLTQEVTSKLAIAAVPPPVITVDQLEQLLQVNVDFASRDAERSLREGNQLRTIDQQRAAWLMSNPKFQSWFKSGLSDMLVIDGMGEITPVSPMSYFCSLMSQELRQIINAVPLSFFCGLHRGGDYMSDATAIMRSLITQLLANPFLRQNINLNFMSFDAILGVQQFRLDFLCELFRRIIGSLTISTAIFVIIDGISWFETELRLGELSFVMLSLRDLVIECNTSGANGGVILKLIITSPKASIHTKHLFPKDKQLVIPSETLGNGQGFNARQMAMQQQRLLGSASSTSSQDSGRLSWMSNSNEGTPSRPGALVGQNYDYFRRSNSSRNSPGLGT
jgi:hypothetical protein